MNILCLNTAFKTATIAVRGKKTVFINLDASAKSSENVLPAIENALMSAGIEIGDVDCVGVVVGPGSFTGVRVGVALVKGFMACFPKLKVVAINSLDLMAFEWQKTGKTSEFCAVQNALSGRFFVKEYQSFLPKTEASLEKNLPSAFKVGLKSEALSEVDAYVEPSEKTLLEMTENLIKENQFVSKSQLAPVYLRLSQAEENLLKKEENAEN